MPFIWNIYLPFCTLSALSPVGWGVTPADNLRDLLDWTFVSPRNPPHSGSPLHRNILETSALSSACRTGPLFNPTHQFQHEPIPPLPSSHASIPRELQDRKWVTWKYDQRDQLWARGDMRPSAPIGWRPCRGGGVSGLGQWGLASQILANPEAVLWRCLQCVCRLQFIHTHIHTAPFACKMQLVIL